ncbi:MAG: bifunctional serine/threonine-protein kinase/formylglycine-generating enzyme family protein [Planctomycetota bacterium]|jgi:serine/threonine protein kinase/formylglycine-generating enzyme required for sulfatase activity
MTPKSNSNSEFEGARLLDRYVVGRPLAAGGMGAVYEGTDEILEEKVVVKVPHARFLEEPGFRERFQREIQELIKLRHPHVVRILAKGEHGDRPYFVLQYLDGGSLQDRVARAPDHRLAPKDVMEWLPDIARTLDFIHEQGIVHRDIKPGNILFDGYGNAYVADFGIAKVLSENDSGITQTGITPGSPAYMAPEQALGKPMAGEADQYALGVVVYEALGGRPPFRGGTPVAVLLKKQTNVPPPLSEYAPAVPKAAADAVMRALGRDPGKRFSTCRSFALAFARGLKEPETRPKPPPERSPPKPRPTPAPPPPPPPRQKRRRESPPPREAPARRQAAPPGDEPARREKGPRKPRRRWPWVLVLLVLALGAGGYGLHVVGAWSAMGNLLGSALEGEPPYEPPPTPAWARVTEAQEAAAVELRVPVAFENEIGMRFVLIPGGTFAMGSPAGEDGRYEDETQHEVTLTQAYYLQITEVKERHIRDVGFDLDQGSPREGEPPWDDDDPPAMSVSWSEAQAFATSLSEEDGERTYRLPTEAEWEFACRADTTSPYWFGETLSEAETRYPPIERPGAVRMGGGPLVSVFYVFQDPNPWGLYDMHGSVFEWCEDGSEPYPEGPVTDPRGAASGENGRIVRGGAWSSPAEEIRSAFRFGLDPSTKDRRIGFRLAVSVDASGN